MHTMSSLDASFLHIEDAVTHMHIGSVGIFEGPAPSGDEALAAIAGRLPLVPRYRQKVRFVPLTLGRPAWVDDPHFSLEYHVRRTALPSPGGDQELRNLVGRVMSQQLDRAKPLWELWIAEGLDHGRWALISKTHHSMVDGVSGTDLMSVLLDSEREPSAPIPDLWRPEPEPGSATLVTRSLAQRAGSPNEAVRSVVAAARGPRRVAGDAVEVGRGLANLRRVAEPGPATSLNGSDRPTPAVGLGSFEPRGRQADPRSARRHRQRRRARGDHAWLSRPAAGPRRAGRGPSGSYAGPGVGPR